LAVGLGLIGWSIGGSNTGTLARGGGLCLVLFWIYQAIPAGPPTECEEATLHNVERDYLPQPGTAMPYFWAPPSWSNMGRR
jgi:hypothetical protein